MRFGYTVEVAYQICGGGKERYESGSQPTSSCIGKSILKNMRNKDICESATSWLCEEQCYISEWTFQPSYNACREVFKNTCNRDVHKSVKKREIIHFRQRI